MAGRDVLYLYEALRQAGFAAAMWGLEARDPVLAARRRAALREAIRLYEASPVARATLRAEVAAWIGEMGCPEDELLRHAFQAYATHAGRAVMLLQATGDWPLPDGADAAHDAGGRGLEGAGR